MRTLRSSAAALAVGLTMCLGAPLVGAQTAFVLDDPVLVADGRRVPVEGAPLRQDRFGTLVLTVPGVGTYTIADAPFSGARRAGEFDGATLVFAADGVSVRLRGRDALLGANRRPAYVQAQPNRLRGGAARVQLGGERSADRPATTARRGPARTETRETPEPLRAEVARLRAEVARLAAEREQAARQRDGARRTLSADLDRLTEERDALRAERDRALRERAALAESMEQARRQTETARERLAQQNGTSERDRAEARRLGAELDHLRREVVSQDEAIALLTAERDNRSEQVARLEAQVRQLTAALSDRTTERDDALARLAEATAAPPHDAEMARLGAEVDRLGHALTETRAERDRLAQLTSVQSPEIDVHEGEMDRLMAEREAARSEIASLNARLAESEAARLALLAELDAARSAAPASDEASRLRAERDALRAQVEMLTAEVERLRDGASSAIPGSTPPPPPPAPLATSSARVDLPGFDFGRLANPDAVRRQLDSVPALDRSGEVLVLFQTDATGQVIRTAVPRPVGGGLDERAEQLVRAMVFTPARVDGHPTGIRSQVLVRFGAES